MPCPTRGPHMFAQVVVEGVQPQRARRPQRPEQVPLGPVRLCHHHALGQALGERIGHVERRRHAAHARHLRARRARPRPPRRPPRARNHAAPPVSRLCLTARRRPTAARSRCARLWCLVQKRRADIVTAGSAGGRWSGAAAPGAWSAVSGSACARSRAANKLHKEPLPAVHFRKVPQLQNRARRPAPSAHLHSVRQRDCDGLIRLTCCFHLRRAACKS